eukprot:scaffold33063_cov65-Phaeocystis_antarctica.AAC.1
MTPGALRRYLKLHATVNMTPVRRLSATQRFQQAAHAHAQVGTKRYAAPELQRAVTPFVALPTSAALAVDIFSLGQHYPYPAPVPTPVVLTIPLPLHPPLPEPLSLQSPEPDPNPNPYLEPHNPNTHQAVVRLARGKKAAAKAKAKARRVLSPAELSAPAKQLIAQLTSKEAQPSRISEQVREGAERWEASCVLVERALPCVKAVPLRSSRRHRCAAFTLAASR